MKKTSSFAPTPGGASSERSLRAATSRLLRPSLLALGFLVLVPHGFADTFSRLFADTTAYGATFTETRDPNSALAYNDTKKAVVFNPTGATTAIALHHADFPVLDELLSCEIEPHAFNAGLSFGLITRVSGGQGVLAVVNFNSASGVRIRFFYGASTTADSVGTAFFDSTFNLATGTATGGGTAGLKTTGLVSGAPLHFQFHQSASSPAKFRLTVTDVDGLVAATGEVALTATSAFNQAGPCGVRFFSDAARANALQLKSFSASRNYGLASSSRLMGGGWVQNVVICPNSTRYYTYVDTGGVYRSDDQGVNWRMIHGNIPGRVGNYETRSLWVDPANADHLLVLMSDNNGAGTGQCLYRSTDGGATWTAKSDASSQIYANTTGRTDGSLIVKTAGATPKTIIVATHGTGVRRSLDGNTWTVDTASLANVFVGGLLVDKRNGDHIWAWGRALSHDGKTFNGGLYRSTDAGVTWSLISSEKITKLVQDPVNQSAFIVIVDDWNVRRSTNDGATWTTWSSGLAISQTAAQDVSTGAYSNYRYQGLAATSTGFVIASCQAQFYTLASGASQWQPVTRVSVETGDWYFNETDHYGWSLGHIVVDPANSSKWIFTDWYGLYKSSDSGTNWVLAIDGIEPQHVLSIAPDTSAANHRLFHVGCSDLGYFRSRDGGKGFERRSVGSSSNIRSISVCKATPSTLYAAGSAGGAWISNLLYKSTDNGFTWSALSKSGLPALKNPPITPDGYACNSIAVNPANASHVYVAVSGAIGAQGSGLGGVFRSIDGGSNWSWFNQDLAPQSDGFFSESLWNESGPELVFLPGGQLFATSPVKKTLYRCDTTAATPIWKAASAPSSGNLAKIAADANPTVPTLYAACTAGGLRKSTNLGVNWTTITPMVSGVAETEVFLVATDPEQPGHLVVASRNTTRNTLWFSKDAGQTWTEIYAGNVAANPYRPPTSLALHRGVLLIGTGANGVFWHRLGSP